MGQVANFLTFEDFVVDAELGRHDITLDTALLDSWKKVFPTDQPGDAVPLGMVAIVSMRSYAAVVLARPPGNLHGTQSYHITRLPAAGETVTTLVKVTGKEQKRERRWVHFRTETRDVTGGLCFFGSSVIAWAA